VRKWRDQSPAATPPSALHGPSLVYQPSGNPHGTMIRWSEYAEGQTDAYIHRGGKRAVIRDMARRGRCGVEEEAVERGAAVGTPLDTALLLFFMFRHPFLDTAGIDRVVSACSPHPQTDHGLRSRGKMPSALSRFTRLRSSSANIASTPLDCSAAVRYGKSVPYMIWDVGTNLASAAAVPSNETCAVS
jgi:hypothetical protein